MSIVWKFRSFTLLIAIIVGVTALADLAAQFRRPAPVLSLTVVSDAQSDDSVASAKLSSMLMPFRSDLKSEYALALASQVLNSEQAVPPDAAQDAVKSSLMIGPHDSLMWLVLALLQTRNNAADFRATKSLKMSYLTGQNRADLIPARLGSVTSRNALTDMDLIDLARGDVRAILTQLPDQRPALAADYARASEAGRRFLRETTNLVDPKYLDALTTNK
ncbi:hypothetical protein WI604_25770 [Bradyrhizobium symbiodeficiens]|uniref:hypothetical protein n=1 Tax=Bradyrhizobium symbiodeficiens TaxID=1404367 RepID=UPI0030D0DDBD